MKDDVMSTSDCLKESIENGTRRRGSSGRAGGGSRALLAVAMGMSLLACEAEAQYLDASLNNATVKVGVNCTNYGGAIAWLSSNGGVNLVNNYDKGRQIQQSYYAGTNVVAANQSSSWSPWPWNPITVGDAYGHVSPVLILSTNAGQIYVKTQPMLWDRNNQMSQSYMEQWITLHPTLTNVVVVDSRFTCFRDPNDEWGGPVTRNQELPAVYFVSALNTIKAYTNNLPWSTNALVTIPNSPSSGTFPWVSYKPTEEWTACVDVSSFGAGVYTPIATTAFLAGKAGSASSWNTYDGSTMYIAPIANRAFTANSVFSYRYYLAVGSLSAIRSAFYILHSASNSPPLPPTGLMATAGNRKVSLAWNPSPNTTNYIVKCATNSGGPYAVIASVATTSYTNTSLINGTKYYYVVTAVNSLEESEASSEMTAVPTGINYSPVASAQSVTAALVGARAVTLQGSDADGDPLIYVIVTSPAHGTLDGTPPNVTYTPAAGYLGGDLFTFKVNDGMADSASAAVSVTVVATLLAEDFEHEWADNALANTTNGWTSIGDGDTTNGWTSIGDGDLSSVTNPSAGFGGTEGGGPFPLHYDHASKRRVLKLDTQGAVLAAPLTEAGFADAEVYVDMMICFKVGGSLPTIEAENANVKAVLCLKANGAATNLYVFHGQKFGSGFGKPVFSVATNACAVVPGTWYRLTIVFGAATCAGGNAEAFRVLLDGKELVSSNAYGGGWKTRVFDDPNTPDGGPWFLSAARRSGSVGDTPVSVTGIGFEGEGFIDDLVETYTEPNFSRGTLLMLY